MIIEMYGMQFDLTDEVDCMFIHDRIIYEKYKLLNTIKAPDIYTKIYKKDVVDTLLEKIRTGGWQYASDVVYTYDTDRFENVSNDFTMCWKKTDVEHDTLVIHLTSFAGHEGRLTSPLTNVSDKLVNYESDLLIVNEDPLRMPETIYPGNMVLGCSSENDTQEKMCEQIKSYIKKDYKKVVIYADSKHAGSSVSLAFKLNGIVTHVVTTGGQSTYSWEYSPWIKSYFKWYNRPGYLEDQKLEMIDVARMHLVKCWKFKELNISQETIDPYRYLSNYKDLKVTYLHGKYDSDYLGFKKYIEQFKSDNLEIVEIDYRISDSQTHNIRPWIDRNLSKFI
jgi:hypothetical protein